MSKWVKRLLEFRVLMLKQKNLPETRWLFVTLVRTTNFDCRLSIEVLRVKLKLLDLTVGAKLYSRCFFLFLRILVLNILICFKYLI